MDSKSWQWFGGGFAVGIVIIGLVWTIAGQKSAPVSVDDANTVAATSTSDTAATGPKPSKNPAALETESTPMMASGETITVQDQAAGATTLISSVSVMHSTWVAIKDTNGRVLGARRADVSTDNLEVSLLRPTVAGQTYQAVLYVDNGDKQFDLHKDTLVVGSEEAPVASTFSAL